MTRTTSVLVTGMLALGLMLALSTAARAEDDPSPSLATLMERLAKLEAENAKLDARIQQLETRPHRRPGRHPAPRRGIAGDAVEGAAGQQPISETNRPEGHRPHPRGAGRGRHEAGRGRAPGAADQRGPRGPGQHRQSGPGGPGNPMEARLIRIEHMLHQLLGRQGPAAGQGRRDAGQRGRRGPGMGPDGPKAPRPPAPPTGPRPPRPKQVLPPTDDGDAPAPVPGTKDK